MTSTEKKSVVITGGASGLGRSLVKLFLERGWNVSTLGRRKEKLEELRNNHSGDSLLAVQCDVRVESQIANFFDQVKEKFGSVDVCILNAGTLGPGDLPQISELNLTDLRMTFETNFFANFNLLKSSLKLKKQRQVIVHITSDAVNGVYPGWGAYGASKTAMDFIVRTLEKEAEIQGINAFSFDPGDMDTEMHHIALPEDRNLKSPDQSAVELFKLIEKKEGFQ